MPLSHPARLEHVGIEFTPGEGFVDINVVVKAIQRTGVESEALLAAAAVAVSLHKDLGSLPENGITALLLLESSEGRAAPVPAGIRAGILVLSENGTAGSKQDNAGSAVREILLEAGVSVSKYLVIPDQPEAIDKAVVDWCANEKLNLLVSVGGTGLAPRDTAPEVLDRLLERRLPGVEETMRAFGQERTGYAMLSRTRAGQRGRTLILALPGSARTAAECLQPLLPSLLQAVPALGED